MRSVFRKALWALATCIALSTASLPFAMAQDAGAPSAGDKTKRLTLQSLKLGSTLAGMPEWLAFRNYACGSNGGPPLAKLSGWSDFERCAPDENGLHEVYFEYDNEAEYILRALDDPRAVRYIGTTEQGFPIVASALFSDDGVLRGLRMVTDARPNYTADQFFDLSDLRSRNDFYLLGPFVGGQVGISPANDCVSLPLGERESPVGGTFVKLDCERIENGTRYILKTRYFRKAGQVGRDAHTGQITQGQYESWTLFEQYQVGYGPAASTRNAPSDAGLTDETSKP